MLQSLAPWMTPSVISKGMALAPPKQPVPSTGAGRRCVISTPSVF